MEKTLISEEWEQEFVTSGISLAVSEQIEQIIKDTPSQLRPTTSIVVPAYNEQEGLPVVLERIFESVNSACEVIVVDDGSKDNTAEVALRFPCKLVKHKVNKGKAEAMKTGIKHALGENVIFIDADGTYPPEVIPQMIEALNSCDAVYGSRANGRDNIPYFNRLGNAMFQNTMKYIYGFRASDYATGLYGLKKCYLDMMDIETDGFNIEVEIAIKASRMNLKVKDIPVEYSSRLGTSKLCGWKVGIGHLKTIISYLTWSVPKQNGHADTTPVISLGK